MNAQVQVQGGRELRRALRAVDAGLLPAMREANLAAARLVIERALPSVPVRSGRLKGTLRALASQRAGRAVAGTARVPYAAAVHWGRKRGNVGRPPGNHTGSNAIQANPFLWEAAQREVERIETMHRDAVMHLVDEILRRTQHG